MENLIITLAAGLIGLILSVCFGLIFGGTIFSPGYGISLMSSGINFGMIFHWSTFGWAMLFCFLMNLLSTGLPALNTARTDIVNSLSGKR